MLSLSRLLCGTVTEGDALRYERRSATLPPHLLHFSEDKRPVVVWNVTRSCNLHCVHCYASAADRPFAGELSTEEGLRVIDMTHEWAGPHSARLMADFGAEVIKVEWIRRLDHMRGARKEGQAYNHQTRFRQIFKRDGV